MKFRPGKYVHPTPQGPLISDRLAIDTKIQSQVLFQALYIPGRVLPYKRLMGMCCWMWSHFQDWTDYNGVAFSIELLEWGRTYSDFWGKTVLHISSQQTYQNVCTVGVKTRVFFIQYKVNT